MTSPILVTGGTRTLGRPVVPRMRDGLPEAQVGAMTAAELTTREE
jgi:nucleoside-diphosphate-sugar epimerase